jgi:hypothetical protein
LPKRTRELFLRAMILLPLLSLSLKMRGLAATQRWLEKARPKRTSPYSMETAQIAVEVMRAVGAAVRHGLGHPTCLEQSLTLWWLLQREGVTSQLRIGVRKDGDKFEAHAWVECEGEALGEPGKVHQHYSAFDAELSRLMEGRP